MTRLSCGIVSGIDVSGLTRIVGPHFEAACRDYAVMADPVVFGGLPAEVGAGVVADPATRTQIQIQIDVAVLAPPPGIRRGGQPTAPA
jgi:hypothetical protein